MASAEGLRRSVQGLSEAEFLGRLGTKAACRAAFHIAPQPYWAVTTDA